MIGKQYLYKGGAVVLIGVVCIVIYYLYVICSALTLVEETGGRRGQSEPIRNHQDRTVLPAGSEIPVKDIRADTGMSAKHESRSEVDAGIPPKHVKQSEMEVPGCPGMTYQKLTTLHREQERAIRERAMNLDEVLLPPSDDGHPGLTRKELTTLHREQEQAIQERAMNLDEVILFPSDDGHPGLTGKELTTLHREQERSIRERALNLDEVVIPPSEDGQPGLTRWQLLDLHEAQEQELSKQRSY
jgi:hypothetical protein